MGWLIGLGLPLAQASAEIQTGAPNFQIVFERNAKDLPREGREAQSNDEALNHIAKVLGRIKAWKDARIVFVGAKPACASDASCDGERLTWLRAQTILATALKHIRREDRAEARFPISVAFAEDVGRTVPSTSGNFESLTPYLQHKAPADAPACGAEVRLRDASLPPLLGSEAMGDSFALHNGERVPASEDTQLSFAAAASSKPHIVWEDAQGRFRKGEWPEDGAFRSVPHAAARLYIIAAPAGNDDVSRFVSSLGNDFASLTRPSFLPPAKQGGQHAALIPNVKGFDDDIRPIRPGTIRPRPRDAVAVEANNAGVRSVSVCNFEFAW